MSKNQPKWNLYEPCTWAASQRLKDLRAGRLALTKRDLAELLETIQDGQEGWGDGTREVTLKEFGEWITGTGDYGGYPPASVQW